MVALTDSDYARLYTKINKTDSCWLWTGGKGQLFRVRDKTYKVQRLLWELKHGKLPTNDIVQNTCGTENCVNPDHMHVVKRGHHWAGKRKLETRNELLPLADNQPPKQGRNTGRRIHKLSEKQIRNFFTKVNKTDTCWLWTGMTTSTGRGKLKLYGIEHTAPRVIYALHYSLDPGNFYVLHTCDDPLCVNPEHLRLGTAQDNTNDMVAKGHFVASKGNTKIKPDSKEEKLLLDETIPVNEVAKLLGITRRTIWKRRRDAGLNTDHRRKVSEAQEQLIASDTRPHTVIGFHYGISASQIGIIKRKLR